MKRVPSTFSIGAADARRERCAGGRLEWQPRQSQHGEPTGVPDRARRDDGGRDPTTLAIPDRPGNHRADTFLNVLENPNVGLMFVVPKRREVVRVSGSALVVKDPPLLESMAVRDKAPALALLVNVREAMFHCGKSMIRSHMWEPDLWGPIDGLPTYGRALVDHAKLDRPVEEMERMTDLNEKYRLYDE